MSFKVCTSSPSFVMIFLSHDGCLIFGITAAVDAAVALLVVLVAGPPSLPMELLKPDRVVEAVMDGATGISMLGLMFPAAMSSSNLCRDKLGPS